MRKTVTFITLGILLHLSTLAQNISVSSFKLLETDLTANTAGTIEKDQNGETAALIKVVTTQTGFSFDCGSMGIVKTLQKPSEIWVYIPRGAKKITISHPQLGLLRDYYFPVAIHAASTYEMVLTTGVIQTIVQQTANSQYLVLKVTPPTAVVELDNEILPTADGIVQKFVKLGTYKYRVQAPDYHTSAGKVTIDDPNNKKIVEITLSPAFGWIELQGDEVLNGAQVFIDNALAGTIPMKSQNLASGQHDIKVVKPLYQPYSQTVTVADNQTTTVTPQLKADFSTVTINVANAADIYVNEEKKGTGSWTGRLGTGSYVLEAKKDGHRSTTMNVEISSEQPTKLINLNAPTPIYGSVNITSTPSMGDVYIDGQLVGQTPLFLPQLIIGNHNVIIRRKGYGDYQSDFVMEENISTEIQASLNERVQIEIKCNNPYAKLFIDDIDMGYVHEKKEITCGEHTILLKYDGFIDIEEKINVDSDNTFFSYIMEKETQCKLIIGRDFITGTEIYVDGRYVGALANDKVKENLFYHKVYTK